MPKETVDTLVEKLKLPRVDALLVDTEGADPAVLKGSQKTLLSATWPHRNQASVYRLVRVILASWQSDMSAFMVVATKINEGLIY